MADPADALSVYDLMGQKPQQAAVLQRARAAELQRQREVALMGMRSDAPEAQAAGAHQLASANEEQRALEQMGPVVLRQALAERGMGLQEKQFGWQKKYQEAELALQAGQLGLAKEALKTGNLLKQQDALRSIYSPFLGEIMTTGGSEASIKAWTGFFGMGKSKLEEMLTMSKEARIKHAQKLAADLGVAPPEVGKPLIPQGGGEAPPPAAPTGPGPAMPPLGQTEMLMRKKYPPKTLTRK